jgi:23S rRNA (adenine2030-N6)-methyltransferase
MNYRHAYHAGNFADCFKHALLIALVNALARKPAPFFALDTHAGAGYYDLTADAALRTQEADAGIRRLLAQRPTELNRYLDLVERAAPPFTVMAEPGPATHDLRLNSRTLYPGSPALMQALMRPADRLACCELHPDDAITLKRTFRHDPRVEVHRRSGWEAIGALLPPAEKRGLVFIDPPFEDRAEFATLAATLRTGHARFRHGMFAAWYPVKQKAAVTAFHAMLNESGIRDIVAIEMHLRTPTDASRLNGCGLLVINPPYQFEDHAMTIAGAVLRGVGDNEPGAGTIFSRLTDE